MGRVDGNYKMAGQAVWLKLHLGVYANNILTVQLEYIYDCLSEYISYATNIGTYITN